MTPKQERERAKRILEQVDTDVYAVEVQFFAECRGIVKNFAENEKYCDRPFARRLTDLFENVLWLREYQQKKITKEEFWKRIEDKARAEAQKQIDAIERRVDRALHPRRKRKKRIKKVRKNEDEKG